MIRFLDTHDWPSQLTILETLANLPTQEESSEKIRTKLEKLLTHTVLVKNHFINSHIFTFLEVIQRIENSYQMKLILVLY